MQCGARQVPSPPTPTLGWPVWFWGLCDPKEGRAGVWACVLGEGTAECKSCCLSAALGALPIREPEDKATRSASGTAAPAAAAPRPAGLGADAQSRQRAGLRRSWSSVGKLEASAGALRCSLCAALLQRTRAQG